MTQTHPCLINISKTKPQYRHFPFLQDQVKIGRAADATYTILSTTISRYHAVIEKQGDNTWTITDNKSLNGIAVNGQRLTAQEPVTLQEDDTVQFGVPASADVPVAFVYRFCSACKPTHDKKRLSDDDGNRTTKRCKMRETDAGKLTEPDQISGMTEKNSGQDNAEDKQEQEKLKALYEEQLQALAQQLKDKEQEKQAIAQQLQEEREERQMIEQKQKEQEEKVAELDNKQKQLEIEKAAVEEQVRRQLEEELQQREESLKTQMQQQLESLAVEKNQLEERLQLEMEKSIQEKDQQLQDRLQGEKDQLQKIIEMKELEQKALENQLAESRIENEKARADSLSVRQAILSEFADTMETELQCAICNELFVKATSLNCSHAFCSLCIRQWLMVKKECPNCRSPVTSQMHSIVLDNYIDRMVEQLTTEMKQSRAQLVIERKQAEEKLDEAEKKAKAGPSGAGAQSRGRRGGRRGRGRGRGQPPTTVQAIVTSPPVTTAATAAAATTTTTSAAAVPPVGATVTLGSSNDNVDAPIVVDPPIVVTAAEAIVVSDAESEAITNSEGGLSDELERLYSAQYDSFGEDPGLWESDRDSLDSDRSSDDEAHRIYVRHYGGYYGGNGRCFKCGRRGHWARSCPYR